MRLCGGELGRIRAQYPRRRAGLPGRQAVDDAETRALLAAAEPRIEARVEAAMEREDVKGAIRAVAAEAEREALAAIDHARVAREASREVEKAAREASRQVEEAMRRVEREARR
jgi:hypothetical protein